MKKINILLVLGCICTFSLAAHPHMSLESSVRFVFDGSECIGFHLEWVFDPYFSAAIIQEHDKDGNRRFSEAEAQNVYNGAFINLRKYGYFIYLRKGNTRVHPEGVQDFVPSIRGDRLVYNFYVNLSGKGYRDDFSVAIFDSTFYCKIDYKENGISITQKKPDHPEPSFEQVLNRAYPVYYDPWAPAYDMTIHSVWRAGLETAYPEELRVFF